MRRSGYEGEIEKGIRLAKNSGLNFKFKEA
jgi:hypothetical protein